MKFTSSIPFLGMTYCVILLGLSILFGHLVEQENPPNLALVQLTMMVLIGAFASHLVTRAVRNL